MIKTATSFTTDLKSLQATYDAAERVLLSCVKFFGDRRVLTSSEKGARMTLGAEVLGASTLAVYDAEAALNTVRAFLATQREDGRFADSVFCNSEGIHARYDVLTGFCFAEEALGLYYLTRKKDEAYLADLLSSLERFDAYLWEHHDLNFNNCLEAFSETETEEGAGAGRYAAVTVNHYGEKRSVSPFPIESGDMMACDVAIRRTIARIYSLLGDEEKEKFWNLKMIDVQTGLKNSLWEPSESACFDRDYRGNRMKVLSIHNLFMMYYGAFDRDMAEAFVSSHMADPDGFGTAFPLPTVAQKDARLMNLVSSDFNGQCRGMNYRRAIDALERYGYCSMLTAIGTKFLAAVKGGKFAERFDPHTGEAVDAESQDAYMPTASATLELISRFFGVRQKLNHLHWGALGHERGHSSEYCFTWGGVTFRLVAETDTSSGFIGDKLLFTVTNGMRVITDLHGDAARLVNVTDHSIDGVFAYRDRTYSFSLAPNEIFDATSGSKDNGENEKEIFKGKR